MNPSRPPYESGCKGVVLTADHPQFKRNALLNIEKPTYLRQSFARSVEASDGILPVNTGTRMCTTYGTGSGFRTHGTPKAQLVFRDFNPEIEYICNIIKQEINEQFNDDTHVDTKVELNSLEIVTYYDNKEIRYHRDQRDDLSGNFVQRENAQNSTQ